MLAETVLARLKPLTRDTSLWYDTAINTNEMLGPGVRFADLVLDSECKKSEGYRRFLDKHWQAAAGGKTDPTGFFVARSAEPAWLTIRTFSRLDYLAALKPFAQALDGLPVVLDEERSWTWDSSTPTSKNRPLYRTAYLLNIELQAAQPFKASAWLKTAGHDVCASKDARADRNVFQLAEEVDLPSGTVISHASTKAGFEMECPSVEAAHKLKDAVFGDCRFEVVAGRKRHDPTVLRITLP